MTRKALLVAVAFSLMISGCVSSAAPTGDNTDGSLASVEGVEDGSLCAVKAHVNTSSLESSERVVVEAKGISSVFRAGEDPNVVLQRMKRGTAVIAYAVDVEDETVNVLRRATLSDDCSLTNTHDKESQ